MREIRRHPNDLAPLESRAERAVALFVESFTLLQKFGNPTGIASGLAGFAALAQQQGQFVRAARLYGAAEAVCALDGKGLAPVACAECECNIVLLLAHLDKATFALAWAEGLAMTCEAAVAYALETAPPFTAPIFPSELGEAFTARELEIMRLIAEGLSNQEIAEAVIMSVGTIKWYTGQIYSKLNVRGRTRAVARARALGLLV